MTCEIVQYAANFTESSSPAVSVGPITVLNGSLLRAAVAMKDNVTFVSISDTAGNVWLPSVPEIHGTTGDPPLNRLRSFHVPSCIGGSVTITASVNTFLGFPALAVTEVSSNGVASLDQIGSIAETAKATTHSVSTAGATDQGSEIVFATLATNAADDPSNCTFTADPALIEQGNVTLNLSTKTGFLDQVEFLSTVGVQSFAPTSDLASCNLIIETYRLTCTVPPAPAPGFPPGGKSWLYDGSTKKWSALKSYGTSRHKAEFSFNLAGNTIVSDFNVGKLYRLDNSFLTDDGVSIERQIVGETVAMPDLTYFDVDCFRLDIEVGGGLTLGQGSNPQIGLEISRDNGKTWGAQMWKAMGAAGAYRTRVEWRRLGTARFFTPRLTVTDPVNLVIVSACLNPEN